MTRSFARTYKLKLFISRTETVCILGILTMNSDVYVAALTIAIICSLESLLSLEASHKLDPTKRVSSPNRELKT